MEQETVLWYY